MTLKEEFERLFVMDSLNEKQMILLSDEVEELWSWIEDKLDKAKIEGEVGKYELSIKLARIKAIDDAMEMVNSYETSESQAKILQDNIIDDLEQLKGKK